MSGRFARAFGLVLGCALFGFVTLLTWGLGSPVGSSPDEGFHLVSVWCTGAEPISDCKRDENDPQYVLVPGLMSEPWVCFYGRPDESAACQGPSTSGVRIRTDTYNQGEYPTPYYAVARLTVTENIEASVQRIRLINVSLATLLLGLGLGVHGRRGWRLTPLVLVVMVPLGLFFMSSVNPTGMAIASATAFASAAIALTKSGTQRGVSVPATIVLLVAAAVASIARRDSVAFCSLLGIVALALDATDRFEPGTSPGEFARRFLRRPATIVLGSVSVVLAAQFVYSGVLGLLTGGLDGTVEGRDGPTVLVTNLVELPRFLLGFFAGPTWGLGWFDTNMPIAVPLVGVVGVAVLLRGMGAISRRGELVALIGTFVVIASAALLTLQADRRYVGESVQPRYFFPLFVGMLVLLAARSTAAPRRGWLVAVVIAASVAHSIALRTNIRRYVSGLDVRSWDLDRYVEWWWIERLSPSSMWATGTIAFALLGALSVAASLRAERT